MNVGTNNLFVAYSRLKNGCDENRKLRQRRRSVDHSLYNTHSKGTRLTLNLAGALACQHYPREALHPPHTMFRETTTERAHFASFGFCVGGAHIDNKIHPHNAYLVLQTSPGRAGGGSVYSSPTTRQSGRTM